jgi:hypothetical protein
MGTPASQTAAQAIARNVAPLVGVLLLGWSARNVLYLYFVDTLLALAVIVAGLTRHFSPPVTTEGWAARLNGEVGPLAVGGFVAAVFAVPLGVWFVFMLGGDLALGETFADPAFLVAAAWQAVAALSSYVSLVEALQSHTPEALHLKRRFALVFLRWMALIFASQFLIPLPATFALVALIAVYAALSVWTEIAPDHFLKSMPGGTGPAAVAPPAAGPGVAAPARRKRRKRRRR